MEIELLAPAGKSRLDLASAIAADQGGTVHRFFHAQAEPSKVPGTPLFQNLTLGFEVRDADQARLAACVDDLTLQADLVREAPPRPGWYRIVSDDARLLRLIAEQSDPRSELAEVLDPVARLFGTVLDPGPGGMMRVNDRSGASVAIAAPLPGERERPCELITAPWDRRQGPRLERLLELARNLGFTAPLEGATHLHFDAAALQSAPAMANLVALLWTYGEPLKQLVGTNPHCRRLGRWPASLAQAVSEPGFRQLGWDEARARLRQIELTKYCDFNLVNCLANRPELNTIEVRILPVHLHSQPILEAAALFAALLERATRSPALEVEEPRPAGPEAVQALRGALI